MGHKHYVDGTGFVALVDHMPLTDLDDSIVSAARVSYDSGSTKHTRSSEGLIRYLLRHWHTTPFEMVEFKFHIKMPIFAARQHLRHRTASVNEISGRYSVLPQEYFVPTELRKQSTTNTQGSDEPMEDDTELIERQAASCDIAFGVYKELIDSGCGRELARTHLPLSTYTEFFWKINLHNLMHYLHLRMDSHAQKEIREYADMIYNLVEPLCPITMKAFMDFRVNSVQFSGPELRVLSRYLTSPSIDIPSSGELSKGEEREFRDKVQTILKNDSQD
tara:strand:+ start:8907 stop:9734 length:828 start_codon:yes stop_codon:yes gene_type:complete